MSGTIADAHGIRVTATWLTADDLFPTYAGLLLKHSPGGTGTPNYIGVETDYADYRELLDTAGASGTEDAEDLTCDVTGLRISRGRDSIGDPIKAGTLAMTLRDADGRHDPRKPPAGDSRSGSNITVEVDPELTGDWVPLFTGFVESWSRNMSAGDGGRSTIAVQASDVFGLMGRALSIPPLAPVGANEKGGARIERLLDTASYVAKWGPKEIAAGLVPMSASNLEDEVLDACHDVTTSEDGIFYAKADGTIHWNDKYWRGLRRRDAALIDITGDGEGELPGSVRLCPTGYEVTDDDIGIVNRAIVWRSTDTDPLVGGSTPPVVKKVNAETTAVNRSISAHGVKAKDYPNLPHLGDTQSQTLANAFVKRLAGQPSPVGNFEIPLTGRHNDAAAVTALEWGDEIVVLDDTVEGVPTTYRFELTGLEHDITPHTWNTVINVDRWIAADPLPVLGVVPGTPGYFTPPGATVPANLAALQALGALGETTAWAPGEFVWLADGSRAYWTGSAWAKGALGDPTGVTEGLPGAFTPGGSVVPLNIAVLKTLGPLGESSAWRVGQWVELQDTSDAWWNGTEWLLGRAPTEGTAGTPGTYDPASTFVSAEQLNAEGVLAVPSTPWDEGLYVPLTGSEAQAHWTGHHWEPGASPGFPKEPLVWDAGAWNYEVWS